MFAELAKVLFETPASRAFFRVIATVIAALALVIFLLLIAMIVYRGYWNAPIKIGPIEIGQPQATKPPEADRPPQTAGKSDIDNISWDWKPVLNSWDTDAECISEMKDALETMKVRDITKDKDGSRYFGFRPNTLVIIDCSVELVGAKAQGNIIALGDFKEVDRTLTEFQVIVAK